MKTDDIDEKTKKNQNVKQAQLVIDVDSLFDELLNILNRTPGLNNSELYVDSNSVVIDWNYQENSKFDIHDAQCASADFVNQFSNIRPTWFSGNENLSIIRVI